MQRKREIESYIVRIYRRGEHETADFVGIVQNPEQAHPLPFRNRDELMAILDGRLPNPDVESGLDKDRS